MSKDITTMSKLKQAEELVHKAVKEWNKGELDKAVYNDSLRKARHLIFEAYYSEEYGEKKEVRHDNMEQD
ncbi:hypothetical protein [Aerococcus sp. UMB9870]|uniref:hypothetical protein n=1 Tax=Aerococcus sp. UMB9870 TaxID=3046351 RepID=UPI002550715C|nr:hypothetical protein [Aerococcus sp. UMB9870]MDK6370385.1 hypothetical protein [Aerococcus sp. UMB9870]